MADANLRLKVDDIEFACEGDATWVAIQFDKILDYLAKQVVRSSNSFVSEGERANVLVVDDDDNLRQRLARLVQAIGFKAIEAKTNAEALELLLNSELSFDLVTTDALRYSEQPDEKGYVGFDLIKKINALLPNLPIILVSTNSPQSLKQAEPDLKVQAVINKSLSDTEIIAIFRKVLDGETLLDL